MGRVGGQAGRVYHAAPIRPRILFVSPRYPYPPWRGDQVRAFHLIKALSGHAEVRVVTFGEGEDEGEPLPLADVEVRAVRSRPPSRLRANLRARPSLPGQVRLFLDTGMARAVDEEIARWKPDVLHVTLARMAPYMPARAAFHRHLDLVDSLALNMRTRAGAHRGPARIAFGVEARLMLAYEARVAASADSCSVVSEADRQMPGLEGAAVIPNGVDLDAFRFSAAQERPPVLAFFGNLGYFHNVEPAKFLAERVLPLVRERVPGARLRLVGARPAPAVRRLTELEGVELAADVPDMAAELNGAAIAVLPSFSGSGIKNKVLEAFCVGLPVVSNRLGVQGVDGAVAGRHYLAAEGADGLAAAAAEVLGERALSHRLAAEAHALILERYTWERQAERLLELYGPGRA
ncbi:MAG TPA: glycosyltransferase [Solirubrobacterales bacterium]|jgi:glycosyltransferase involved in cell wall biosynthesis|nr:glycosyltransferase [Solirubrobacterales bacterium]